MKELSRGVLSEGKFSWFELVWMVIAWEGSPEGRGDVSGKIVRKSYDLQSPLTLGYSGQRKY